MRIPIFALALSALPILIGGGLSHAARELAVPVPGLSPQAVGHYEQMLESLEPETGRGLGGAVVRRRHSLLGIE